MKRFHLPQVSIVNFVFLIGATACALFLERWVGVLVTVLIVVFPFSLLVERLFGATPTAKARLSSANTTANLIVLVL